MSMAKMYIGDTPPKYTECIWFSTGTKAFFMFNGVNWIAIATPPWSQLPMKDWPVIFITKHGVEVFVGGASDDAASNYDRAMGVI